MITLLVGLSYFFGIILFGLCLEDLSTIGRLEIHTLAIRAGARNRNKVLSLHILSQIVHFAIFTQVHEDNSVLCLLKSETCTHPGCKYNLQVISSKT